MVKPLFDVEAIGIRDAQGRFARATEILETAQLEAGEVISREVAAIYRERAPKGTTPREGERFADSITGHVIPTGRGIEVMVSTDQSDLERWLREGTPAHAIVGRPWLAFESGGEMVVRHSVWHPGVWRTSGNPHWEEGAELVAVPLAIEQGNRIAVRVVEGLTA